MKISYARGVLLALGLTCGATGVAQAQEGYGAPSLLPLPQTRQDYAVQPAASFKRYQAEEVGPAVGSPYGHPVTTGGGPVQGPIQGPVQGPPAPYVEPVSPFEAAMGGAWSDGGYGCGSGDSCDTGTCAIDACCNPCTCWWVGAGFLYMGRDNQDFHQIAFDTGNPVGSILSSDSASMNFSPGFQINAGRWFCDGAFGVEAVYWGIFPENQSETAFGGAPSNLNSVYDFGTLNIGGGNIGGLWDNSAAQRIQRSWNFQNVELNLLQGYNYNCGSSFSVGMIGGVRYFRFDEGFQYATADAVPVFGADPANEAYYDIDVENHLVGVQLGARANWLMTQRFQLHATPKVGVFNNHVSQMQRIYNSTGTAVVDAGNPLAGTVYDINSSKDDVSLLAELDIGFDYRFSCHWSINAGYRAVAITGVALATSQIPVSFGDIPGAQDIDNDESLILHGGYLGATYAW